ncbi:TRAP transporter small permease subunit [Roseibium litorale]|uniref:TRAP transporter small permease protein n=1 Tax=Roseibium litorale TaxID=2803841 RepID=A0ABR9CJM9_9HYPH|nr:TRAP transporter small permease subunit [Roseibium litorale]MBD8891047.1 TRAP transporter small permease subunit [Roseibium litorale]
MTDQLPDQPPSVQCAKGRFARLSGALESVAAALLIALLLFQVLVVALRYVFSYGTPWALDLLTYLFFLATIAPAPALLIADGSVRVDVFYARWSDQHRALADRIALLFLLFPAMAWATWVSLPETISSFKVLEASPSVGGLPGYFLLKGAMTAFFASLALTALVLGLKRRPYRREAP